MRRKLLPTYVINGWFVDKEPNSFGSKYAYTAVAVDAEGYQTAKHGFQSLREAREFCEVNDPPKERA